MLRYRVEDVPPRGGGAFCPLPATTPRASSKGLVHVFGAPGTLAVPAPKPAATPDWSMDPHTIPSNVSPDVITPAVYVPLADNMHPPVPVRHHNNLPVPAISYVRAPQPAMVPPGKVGGRSVMPRPRSFQRFPARRA